MRRNLSGCFFSALAFTNPKVDTMKKKLTIAVHGISISEYLMSVENCMIKTIAVNVNAPKKPLIEIAWVSRLSEFSELNKIV